MNNTTYEDLPFEWFEIYKQAPDGTLWCIAIEFEQEAAETRMDKLEKVSKVMLFRVRREHLYDNIPDSPASK